MLGDDGRMYDDEDLDDGLLTSYADMESELRGQFAVQSFSGFRVEYAEKMPIFTIDGDNLPLIIKCDAPKDYYFVLWGTSVCRFSFVDPELLAAFVVKIVRGSTFRYEICRGINVLHSGFFIKSINYEFVQALKKEHPDYFDGAKFDRYQFGIGLVAGVTLTKDTEWL